MFKAEVCGLWPMGRAYVFNFVGNDLPVHGHGFSQFYLLLLVTCT